MVTDRASARGGVRNAVKSLGKTAVQAGLWLLRLALSGVFIYAGALKLRDPHSFSESVASFRLLPPMLVNPVALTLPMLELFAAVMALGAGRWRRLGAFSLLALLVVFLLALATALARGINVDCGCFGADNFDVLAPSKNLWGAIGRDLALGASAWVLYAVARNTPSLPG